MTVDPDHPSRKQTAYRYDEAAIRVLRRAISEERFTTSRSFIATCERTTRESCCCSTTCHPRWPPGSPITAACRRSSSNRATASVSSEEAPDSGSRYRIVTEPDGADRLAAEIDVTASRIGDRLREPPASPAGPSGRTPRCATASTRPWTGCVIG